MEDWIWQQKLEEKAGCSTWVQGNLDEQDGPLRRPAF